MIFSDTISTMDFSNTYHLFVERGISVIRKGNRNYLKDTEYANLIDVVDVWIDIDMPTPVIIERISKITNSNFPANEKPIGYNNISATNFKTEMFFNSLSSKERRLLYLLFKADGKVLARDQLSGLKNRICKKLVSSNFPEDELSASWKKGYFIGTLLMKELKKFELFENFDTQAV